MSETLIAFRCKDFVVTSAAGLNAFYYIKITDHEDKITQLDSHKLLACTGENGPRTAFTEYIKANLRLNTMREHGRNPSTPSAAAFMRETLASSLRSRDGPYACNSLVAGFDLPASEHDDTEPTSHLYYLDYLGTLQSVPFAAHGYGAPFVTAILDRLWRIDLTPQEAVDLMQHCVDEVKKRVIISNAHFFTKVINATGVQLLENVH